MKLLADLPSEVGRIIFPPGRFGPDATALDIIIAVMNWIFAIAGGLAVLAIVYSGIMYITAGGDPAKSELAKKNFIWALTGIIVLLGAVVIMNFVRTLLGG